MEVCLVCVYVTCIAFFYFICLCCPGENEFEESVITPYSSPPELPDVMKAPEVSATANE